jgi:hypothetical protein
MSAIGWLYRKFKIFAHKHNWHQMEPNPNLERGKIHYWCHWCGIRAVENVPYFDFELSVGTLLENHEAGKIPGMDMKTYEKYYKSKIKSLV